MMEFDLVPLQFKKTMWMVRRVAIVAEIFCVLILLLIGIMRVFHDLTTAVIFSTGILSISTLLLIPGFLYERISQSTVEFTVDRIKVFDRHGRCWREIPYSFITSIRTENISGFFYGKDKHLCTQKYICFYLNNTREIPRVSYAKLFNVQNFFMVAHQCELEDLTMHKFNNFLV